MKKISREILIKRAIWYSLRIQKLKEALKSISKTEFILKSQKIPLYSLELNKKYTKKEIKKLEKEVIINIFPLLYENLKIPSDKKKRKIFGEISTKEYFDIIDKNITYNCINFISSSEMKKGYVLFTELIDNVLDVEEIEMMLDLNTGEFISAEKENLAKTKPVDTSMLERIVISI